ncbi:hypothetical protein [Candidatus Magnetominusculus dajiuhuensis]
MRVLLIAYDNMFYIQVFPMALAAIMAILKKSGYEEEFYVERKFIPFA